MVNKDFQKELTEKVKEGIKPSHLKRSSSTHVKSAEKENFSHEAAIKKLEAQKEELLAINQAAVSQNEQLAAVIDKLKAEKKNLQQEKSKLEEQLLEKRLALLKTPLTAKSKPAFIPTPSQRNELELRSNFLALQRKDKEKNVLIIFLLITLSGTLLLK